jgi:structural maintenance of chromosome 4
LQKAFNEKLEAYEEVKHHVDVLVKEAKRFEKEELSLGEKRKHLITKQKKLKKAITDVREISERTHSLRDVLIYAAST